MEVCDNLSKIVTLESASGDWESYEKQLYNIFSSNFIDIVSCFMGKPIGIFTTKMYHGKEKTFWHIISEGPDEFNREPDIRRCERIGWVKDFILMNVCTGCNEIRIWKSLHKNKKMRYKIWCVTTDYIVILEERKNAFMLITAYIVTYGHIRRQLNKEYSASEKFTC